MVKSFSGFLKLIVFSAVLSAGIHPFVYALDRKEPFISSDEMLEFTLNDLKVRLQEVVAENSKISARNNALRKRMLALQRDMRELENHKLNLLERNNDLKDYIKMDSREQKLTQKKIAEIEAQNSFSDDVSDTLAKTIEDGKARHQKLQTAIAKVQDQVDGLRQGRSNKELSQSNRPDESKNDILKRIRETGARNRDLERKLPELQKKVANIKEKKNGVVEQKLVFEISG